VLRACGAHHDNRARWREKGDRGRKMMTVSRPRSTILGGDPHLLRVYPGESLPGVVHRRDE